MAKQTGPFFITGTIGDICFYKMDGEYYARMKSSLSGKRVKKDPKFRRTMEYATLMAQASKIASGVYRLLPAEERKHALYRKMTGQALRMLKEGLEVEQVKCRLYNDYIAARIPAPVQEVEEVAVAKNSCEKLRGNQRPVVTAGGILRMTDKVSAGDWSSMCYMAGPHVRGYPERACDENFIP